MSFLLDTNAVSEPKRKRPDLGFMGWLVDRTPAELQTSVLVVGELQRGASKLPDGERRRSISEWLDSVIQDFGERVLPVDVRVARRWAHVSMSLQAAGTVVGVVDELIAATALAHRLTLVTRNVRHFRDAGCDLLCPWET